MTDELVAVVTDDLVVRSRPGTGSDSEIYMGRLNAPDLVYVIAGPESADGYDWYLVDPVREVCYLGCDFEPQPGWVAAAGKDGERWLAREPVSDPNCPEPTLNELISGAPQLHLYCFGGRDLTVNGVVGNDSIQDADGWAWKYSNWLYPADYRGPVTGCMDACYVPMQIAFDGDTGLAFPLSAVRVTGHFDDPKADECRYAGPADAEQRLAAHECRMVFVVTSWTRRSAQ